MTSKPIHIETHKVEPGEPVVVRVPDEVVATLMVLTTRGPSQDTDDSPEVRGFNREVVTMGEGHCPAVSLYLRNTPFKDAVTYDVNEEITGPDGATRVMTHTADPVTEMRVDDAGLLTVLGFGDELSADMASWEFNIEHSPAMTNEMTAEVDGIVIAATNSQSVATGSAAEWEADTQGWWSGHSLAGINGATTLSVPGPDWWTVVTVAGVDTVDRDPRVVGVEATADGAIYDVDWDGGPELGTLVVGLDPVAIPEGSEAKVTAKAGDEASQVVMRSGESAEVELRVKGSRIDVVIESVLAETARYAMIPTPIENLSIPDWENYPDDPFRVKAVSDKHQVFVEVDAKSGGRGTENDPFTLSEAAAKFGGSQIPPGTRVELGPGNYDSVLDHQFQFRTGGAATDDDTGWITLAGPPPGEGVAELNGNRSRYWSMGTGSKFLQFIRLEAHDPTMNQRYAEVMGSIPGPNGGQVGNADRFMDGLLGGSGRFNPGKLGFQMDGWGAIDGGQGAHLAPHHSRVINGRASGMGEGEGGYRGGAALSVGSVLWNNGWWSLNGRSNMSHNIAGSGPQLGGEHAIPIFTKHAEAFAIIFGTVSYRGLQLVTSAGIGQGSLISDGNPFISFGGTDSAHGHPEHNGDWIIERILAIGCGGSVTGFGGSIGGAEGSFITAALNGLNVAHQKNQNPWGDIPIGKVQGASRAGDGAQLLFQRYSMGANQSPATSTINSSLAMSGPWSSSGMTAWGELMRVAGSQNYTNGRAGASAGAQSTAEFNQVQDFGFVNPVLDVATMDWRLQANSPLVGGGNRAHARFPFDLVGAPLPENDPIQPGALQETT